MNYEPADWRAVPTRPTDHAEGAMMTRAALAQLTATYIDALNELASATFPHTRATAHQMSEGVEVSVSPEIDEEMRRISSELQVADSAIDTLHRVRMNIAASHLRIRLAVRPNCPKSTL